MLFDKIINTAFSFGAAVVIFGAWGKIEHKEFGSTALTAGLLTETAIFCIYGILEWRKKPETSADGTMAEDARQQGMQADERGGLVNRRGGPGRQHGGQVESAASPMQPEQVEALTDSIRQASQVLTKVFRL
jgi:hypothetical protein